MGKYPSKLQMHSNLAFLMKCSYFLLREMLICTTDRDLLINLSKQNSAQHPCPGGHFFACFNLSLVALSTKP